MNNRCAEVRELLRLTPEQVQQRAGDRLTVTQTLSRLHQLFAERIFSAMTQAAESGEQCRLIVPVGPTGQYPLLADLINEAELDLAHCWFFFMDEYAGENGEAVPRGHPLSFKRKAHELFFARLKSDLLPPDERVVFPDENNVERLAGMIERGGGIDVCYGGIGIHGHVAFNEPEEGVLEKGPRKVRLNDFTVTINAVRAGVGGNLECFPRHAFTLGMPQLLAAKRVELFCRNGCEFDWANTVLRLALFGTEGDDYPVTYVRRSDYRIFTDKETLRPPENLI